MSGRQPHRIHRTLSDGAPVALTLSILLRMTAPLVSFAAVVCAENIQPVPVTLQTVGEDARDGDLVAFSLDRGVRFRPKAGAEIRLIPSQDVVQITIAGPPAPLAEQGLAFELANGDRLSGRVLAFENDRVQVETPALGPVHIPLGAITRLSARRAEGPARAAANSLLDTRRQDDLVLLNNGDTATGLIAAIDAEGVVLETPGGQTRIPLDRVAVAVLVPDTVSPDRGLSARLTLLDETRLTVGAAQWPGASDTRDTLDVSPWDSRTAVPFDQVRRIEIHGGRWTWLSRRGPSEYVHTPMLSLAWPWQADRNVLGNPLRVAGRTFERGLGVHSESTLRYALDRQYDSFVTHFGMDDDSGPYANVDVEIRVDGHIRFEQKRVTPGHLHGPVRIDLKGAEMLELRVGFGANGTIQDRFDWIEPGLIRPTGSPTAPAPG